MVIETALTAAPEKAVIATERVILGDIPEDQRGKRAVLPELEKCIKLLLNLPRNLLLQKEILKRRNIALIRKLNEGYIEDLDNTTEYD
ncbi:hypothetical protein ACJMK2_027369 [Sinanodonta woodiana]|uniref:Uncharacterized protein n=1 Tax=Sinanodonta woodiana TaxID=1069815 RepID=A0ABD3XMW2_SINWO